MLYYKKRWTYTIFDMCDNFAVATVDGAIVLDRQMREVHRVRVMDAGAAHIRVVDRASEPGGEARVDFLDGVAALTAGVLVGESAEAVVDCEREGGHGEHDY